MIVPASMSASHRAGSRMGSSTPSSGNRRTYTGWSAGTAGRASQRGCMVGGPRPSADEPLEQGLRGDLLRHLDVEHAVAVTSGGAGQALARPVVAVRGARVLEAKVHDGVAIVQRVRLEQPVRVH